MLKKIPSQPNNYHFFLDESGDHGLNFIDENFPIFLLAGIILEDKEYIRVSTELENLKETIFGTKEAILHSREIRKCEGTFQVLFDLEVKKSFYEGLNNIISNAHFTIISVAIDKKRHIEKYGKTATNPYMICMSHILERLVFCLDEKDKNSTVRITIEKRGKKEDQQLLTYYNTVLDRGTYYVTSERLKHKIAGFTMAAKRDNLIGIQIADLCAYPIARHILNTQEPYIPFTIIKNKLYSDRRGVTQGYGLKVFP